MLRWYLIHTKPLSEALAGAHLAPQGCVIYRPHLLETINQRQRRIERALFSILGHGARVQVSAELVAARRAA
jgi:hypothetical protein